MWEFNLGGAFFEKIKCEEKNANERGESDLGVRRLQISMLASLSSFAAVKLVKSSHPHLFSSSRLPGEGK